MLFHFELYTIIFLTSNLILQSTATTHWFVTGNGKIQSQCGSAFRTNQPHDLLTFLDQDNSVQSANILCQKMLSKRIKQWIDLSSVVNMEQNLYFMDKSCPFTNKLLFDINFYTIIVTNSSLIGVK